MHETIAPPAHASAPGDPFAAFELLPDAVIVHRRGAVLFANDAARALLSVPAGEDLRGRHLRDLVDPATLGAIEADQALLAGGRSAARRRPVRGPDGATRTLEAHAREVDHDGAPATVVVLHDASDVVAGEAHLHQVVRDLTALRRAARDRQVLAGLVAAMADAVVVSDADHRVTEWSGGAEAIFGWSREEAIGKCLLTDLETEHRADPAATLARIDRGEPVRVEVRVRRKDGRFADLDMHVVPLRGAEGRLDGVLTVARDVGPAIAARRAIEASDARLRAAEADLRAVLSHLPDAVLAFRGHRVAFANSAAASLLGYATPGDLHGVAARDLVPDDVLPELTADVERIDRGERVVRWCAMRRRDGTYRVVEAHGAALQLDGAPAVVAVLRERTAIDEARRALRASVEELRSTFAAMAEGVVVQDRDGHILRANAAAARILGLTRDELEGSSSRDPRWRAVHEDGSDFPGEDHPAMRTLRTGEPCAHEIMGVYTPDGELRWISISSEPLRVAPGEPPHGVVATFTDVTALRRTADELRDALAKVKTLSGAIPFCMYCNKIRDEAGTWQRADLYLASHTDALASHGLCPTCASARFPEIFDDDDGDEGR